MDRTRDSLLTDTRLNRISSSPQTVVYVSLITFGLVTMTMSARAMLQACNAKERKSNRGSRNSKVDTKGEITRSSSGSSEMRFKNRISSDPGPVHQVSAISFYAQNANGGMGRERPQLSRQNSGHEQTLKYSSEADASEEELLARLVAQEEERWMHCSDILRNSSKSCSMISPSVAVDQDFWGTNLDVVHTVPGPQASHARSFLEKRSTSPKQSFASQSFILSDRNDPSRAKRRSQATSGSRYYANMVMRKMHTHSFDRQSRSSVEAIYAESFGVTPMEDLHRVSSLRT
eukprot:766816-Hanusia_phi.AAC.4